MSGLWTDFLNWAHATFVAQWDLWLIIGFIAQAMFTMRFVVQWIASERAGKSIVPVAFWFFSIAGGGLLFVYALQRGDPVFIVGQGAGLFIYLRNVWLIVKEHKEKKFLDNSPIE
ncbi:MAG: lipid-A-disaccharide synthase N-terminal domain-containing protein [Cohaesibacter sp.]|nr:lipid-A-disaccharide synthase N-terminal domain-containing protein [Cohaesibacter sp.]MCV6574118.1 lipid-A-disaccharide synthase N-terminal domain-containing protein [Cohaesibacter sp.]MCV6601395.1 lipid-A-disaccharide synthase N-terminal domain-containing protein [Cohaesibacter sp.]